MESREQVRTFLQQAEAAARQEAAVRRRAHAARMSLYFLGIAHRVNDSWLARRLRAEEAVNSFLPFALEQVESLMATQGKASSESAQDTKTTTEAESDASETPTQDREPSLDRDQVSARLGTPTKRQLKEIYSLDAMANEISSKLETAGTLRKLYSPLKARATEGPEPPAEVSKTDRQVADETWDLTRSFLDGLRESEPHLLRALLSIGLPNVLFWLHKNLALLWAFLVVAFVAFRIEAVNSLFRNDPFYTAICVVVVALPIVAAQVRSWTLGRRRGSKGELRPLAPVWDIGGRPFRSLSPPAIEPNRFVRRWPATEAGLELEPLGASKRAADLLRVVALGRFFRFFAYVGWWVVGGLAVWASTASNEPYLTTYVIVALLALILAIAQLVDFWDFTDAWPVRFGLLLFGLGAAGMVALGWEEYFFIPLGVIGIVYAVSYAKNPSRILRAGIAGLALVLATVSVFKSRTNERESWCDEGISGCAEGGGEIDRLTRSEWPIGGPEDGPIVVMAASGGGSRAAIYTAHTLERLHADYPEVAERLQAISSVSGGSLANAAYVARLVSLSADPVSDLVAAVVGDFLRPTLKGAAWPGTSRGQAIQSQWEEAPDRDEARVHLGDTTLNSLATAWRESRDSDSSPPFPIPLFNTTTLDGHDVVLSPLEQAFYTRSDLEPLEPVSGETWVHNRDAVYGLEDLLPHYDPKLSGAVRASANFPFGFPLVWVQTRQPISFSPLPSDRQVGTKKSVFLTDGGALSNSGMWSLFNLLTNPELVGPLRERGVLLIIVDASKMPAYPALRRKYGTLWSAIGDQSPIGQALHRAMLDRLGALYCSRIALFEMNLTPTLDRNVLTTWALSKKKRDELALIFEERWESQHETLADRWNALVEDSAAANDCGGLLRTTRPPLD